MVSESTHSMPLIIRADASSRIGTGHVMRCIALGQAWRDGRQRTEDGGRKSEVRSQGSGIRGQESEVRSQGSGVRSQGSGVRDQESGVSSQGTVVFMTCCDNAALLQRLRDEKFTVIELTDPAEFISTLSPDSCTLSPDSWFVLDGYHFTLEDQRAVRAAGCKLLVIDDCSHLPEYECDILLNQNINAAELNYTINPEARLLLGTDYILLRREFFQGLEKSDRKVPRSGKINLLITMGGADPDNVTLKVIEALKETDLPELEAKIIVGPANPHLETLKAAAAHSTFDLRLLTNVEDVAELMNWADFAISAAGSTCWELLAMGVPFATVILADNQEGVASYLEQHAGVPCLGWGSENIAQRIIECLDSSENFTQDRSVKLVDGLGAGRVVERLHEYQGCSRDP